MKILKIWDEGHFAILIREYSLLKIAPNFLKIENSNACSTFPAIFSIVRSCYMSLICVALLVLWRGYYRDEAPCIIDLKSRTLGGKIGWILNPYTAPEKSCAVMDQFCSLESSFLNVKKQSNSTLETWQFVKKLIFHQLFSKFYKIFALAGLELHKFDEIQDGIWVWLILRLYVKMFNSIEATFLIFPLYVEMFR